MNIAIIYSPNWAEYVKVELYSLFKNNPSLIKVYLISDEGGEIDTKPMLEYFDDGYKIEFINAEDTFTKYITTNKNVSSRFTKFALYRLMLPEMIQEDRVIHIDADAMVVGDIRELWNMNIGDNYIAGAIDIGADRYNLKRPIGLGINDNYVNAGVLLMNLKKIREDNIMKKWIYEANTKKYTCHDQCIINKICKDKISIMDNKYNVSISTGLNIVRDEVKIVHWAGNIKPWTNSNVPFPNFWYRTNKEYKQLFGGENNG